jgi:intracellular sulfur oxidation DsrE/DsrF family protein
MFLFRNFCSQLSNMNRILIQTTVFLIASASLLAQSKPYNIVFDLTTSDTATHQRVMRWAKAIVESDPNAKVEIVFYGRALDMVVKNKSTVAADVIKLGTEKKVTFAACEHAMQIFNISKNQLLNGVTTVPDALYELIVRQAEGYGYIKVTN